MTKPVVQGVTLHHRYVEDLSFYTDARPSQRLFAFLVDFIFQSTVMTLIFLPFSGSLEEWRVAPAADRYHLLTFLLTTLTFCLYTLAPLALTGQTLGKKIFGLRLVRADHRPIAFVTQIFLREVFGKPLALIPFGLGCLSGLVGPDHRFFYDILLQTRVLQYRDHDFVKNPY